ncbi:MYXO-CTERM sorting domain-containing protein [Candidatus Binatia bacterium]|nr:MYXO-CTERM sorting domain-containing protein [Candidatus Binatia bacterium]
MGQRLGRMALWGAVLPVAGLLFGSATAWGQGIQLSDVETTAGQQVQITATLKTGGGDVAGTQNDFTFATTENRTITVVRKTNGRPDCAVNPEINKTSTTFAFQPPSCTAETCTAVRAIVFSSEDVEPIADGSVLYTCKVQVAAEAQGGTYPLTISGTILSNPTGGRVCGPAAGNPPCSEDKSGSVVIPGGGPTPTPTEEPPTPTPTEPAPTGPGIKIGSVQTTAGQQVTIDATLATGGGDVAGTQNDFTFATEGNRQVTVVRKTNGRPDCAVNPEINKTSTTFAFQPPSCTAETCTAVRAIVFSSEDVEPIADGAVLYTCKIQVAESAPDGVYPLTISGTILSNPTGGRVCGPAAGNPPCTGDQSGAVTVGVVGPTATPTQGEPATPTPTEPAVMTPTSTATSAPPTVTSTSAPTRTATASPTIVPGITTLANDITAATLQIPVINYAGFPRTGTVKIGTEQIKYDGIGTTPGDPQIGLLLNAVRGANGTTAQSHSAGSVVTLLTPTPTYDDDGCDCRVASSGGNARTAWLVLIPVAALLVLRRRSK